MSGPSTYQPQNAVIAWIERRLPIFGLIHSSFIVYPVPRNLNYWWTFGGILSFMLAVQIVTGVIRSQLDIDPTIDNALSNDWPVGRIDATLRAILRAAAWELLRRRDIPAGVVITEYVDIAKAFYEDDAPKMVNAVLDSIAKQLAAAG